MKNLFTWENLGWLLTVVATVMFMGFEIDWPMRKFWKSKTMYQFMEGLSHIHCGDKIIFSPQ
jgi:hypothetical protein